MPVRMLQAPQIAGLTYAVYCMREDTGYRQLLQKDISHERQTILVQPHCAEIFQLTHFAD